MLATGAGGLCPCMPIGGLNIGGCPIPGIILGLIPGGPGGLKLIPPTGPPEGLL